MCRLKTFVYYCIFLFKISRRRRRCWCCCCCVNVVLAWSLHEVRTVVQSLLFCLVVGEAAATRKINGHCSKARSRACPSSFRHRNILLHLSACFRRGSCVEIVRWVSTLLTLVLGVPLLLGIVSSKVWISIQWLLVGMVQSFLDIRIQRYT